MVIFQSFFPCVILYIIWLEDGLESMKLQNYKKYICFESRKRTQKQAQQDMNEMEWNKMDFLISSAMRMRKRHLFCTSSHHNVPYEKQQELNKGSESWNEWPCKSACAIVKYALHYTFCQSLTQNIHLFVSSVGSIKSLYIH